MLLLPFTLMFKPNKVQQFQFQTSRILLVLRNYMDQKFHHFYHLYYNFCPIYNGFSIFQTTQAKQATLSLTLEKSPILNAIQVLASIDILFYIIYIINTMKKHYFILFYNFYVLYSFVFKMQKRSCFESAPTHPSTPYFTICNYALALSKNPLTHLQICGFYMSRLIQIS